MLEKRAQRRVDTGVEETPKTPRLIEFIQSHKVTVVEAIRRPRRSYHFRLWDEASPSYKRFSRQEYIEGLKYFEKEMMRELSDRPAEEEEEVESGLVWQRKLTERLHGFVSPTQLIRILPVIGALTEMKSHLFEAFDGLPTEPLG